MSKVEFSDTCLTEDSQNANAIVCSFTGCNSLILRAEKGKLGSKKLPEGCPTELALELSDSSEPCNNGEQKVWELASAMDFENVGVSKNVPNTDAKFLLCADCDRGPVGFMLPPMGPAYLFANKVLYKV
ncbi:hypothetical protein DSO57_1039042 [Entomophthora muscae]|uniref:Uncharacterized protein n=1 Tax=Entomophthora muscae TaxID=34485 RepID=A0ACC2TKX4_9FUNG|nr:hypothetical protein DSO57_1039042 [Entomophthora muscae]